MSIPRISMASRESRFLRAAPSGCSSLTLIWAQKEILSKSLIRMAQYLDTLTRRIFTMTGRRSLKAKPTWSKFGSTLMTVFLMMVGSSNGVSFD